jgi:hypothetical protein
VKKLIILTLVVGLALPLLTTGCLMTHTGRMATAGALVGAAIGATAPAYDRDRAILTGAAVGAVVGASIGAHEEYGGYYYGPVRPHYSVYVAPPPPPRTHIIIETGPSHYRTHYTRSVHVRR